MSKPIAPAVSDGGVTTNHETIRRWAQRRDAQPARTTDSDDSLRFRFPNSDRFTPIAWDAFFQTFEREHLAFVYEPERRTRPGEQDYRSKNFYKFVDRETV